MKIVCDSCQAKYSISDDKVQGKVFKIRCKKCSNIIVVRGGQSAVEPAPAPAPEKDTRVYDYGYDGAAAPAGDDAVWHVVINQDQVGPMTAAEVQQRFASGDIDADTYIWREGFGDWLPIAQVDTFAEYVASGSTTAAVSSRAGQDAVSAMFGGGGGGDESGTVRSDPGDLFAAASSGSARHQAASVPADDDGDLFGSKPAAASASASVSASGKGGGDKLRGERNENSVLFSLGNLAQLASDKPAPVTAAPSSGGHATGAAGGEGSGLIDIRSMANAYLGGGGAGAAAKPATSSAIGSMDDLPVFGGGGFSEPAVMMPTAARQNNSKLMVALIGSVAALAVAAVILVVVLVGGGDDKKQVAATADDKSDVGEKPAAAGSDDGESGKTPDEKTAAATGDGSSAATGTDGDKPAAPSEPAGTAKDPEPAQVAAKEPEDKPAPAPKPEKTTKPSSSKPSSRPEPRPEKPAAVKPEKPAKAESGGGCDEVGCVISGYEGACCAKYKKGGGSKPSATAGGAKSDLPSSLDRSAISEGVAKVKGRVMACGDKSSAKGTVKVSVKVTADGNVSSVSVKESPDGSLGTCVANAMQKASFKKTQSGGSFSYPFVF